MPIWKKRPGGTENEKIDRQGEQKWPQGHQKWSKGHQKWAQRELKGAKRAPKVSQMDQNGDQNQHKINIKDRVAKKMKKGGAR